MDLMYDRFCTNKRYFKHRRMKNIVVITGMHRSGTSWFTNYMQKCGLHLGDSLLRANKGNVDGLFEDVSVLRFHQEILGRTGHGCMIGEEALPDFKLLESDKDRIKDIVEKLAQADIFGFKEPRTSLFLNMWNEAIPVDLNKTFIFLFRSPSSVVDSILRRGLDTEITANPLLGYKCWYLYNKALLDFYEKHPDQCLFIPIKDFIKGPDKYMKKIVKKFRLELNIKPITEVYKEKEFKESPESFPREVMKIQNLMVYIKCYFLYKQIKMLSEKAVSE